MSDLLQSYIAIKWKQKPALRFAHVKKKIIFWHESCEFIYPSL